MKIFYAFLIIPFCNAFNLLSTRQYNRLGSLKMVLENPSETIKQVSRFGIGKEWSYQDFLDKLNHNEIDGVSIMNTQEGFAAVDNNYQDVIEPSNIHYIRSIPSMMDDLLHNLNMHHTNYDIFKVQEPFHVPVFVQFVGFYLAGLVIINIFNAIRGGGGLPGQSSMPGQSNPFQLSKGNEVDTTKVNVNFNDVAGCEEAKFELVEIVDFLKNPKKYEDAGAKIPSGVLLEGEPGTGKTLLARAVAGEAGVSFLSASGSEFIEMYVGLGAQRVRKLFSEAEKKSPCVVFIDEIDAVGRQRGAGINSGNDEREQTLNQILTNMDGFTKSSGIIVLAATNRADILDSALLRPGRFDRKITVPLPDLEGRKEIFKVHLKDKKVEGEADLNELAVLTTGFSGADICNLANEAAILSVRNNMTSIDRKTFLDAYEKITIGLPSNKEVRDKEILKLVSYHEIGHALMVKYFEEFFDLRKVTINANQGGAGGYTLFTPKERYINYPTKKFMLANLVIALGGRAAEVVLYGNNNKKNTDVVFQDIKDLEITTGASNDLKQANSIARKYVSIFGLSDDISLSGKSDMTQPFLGKELGLGGDKTSEYSKERTDKMVADLINNAYKISLNLIKSNPEEFHGIADKLLMTRNLSGDDFDNIHLKYL
tara:strand:+ start:1884 stop:3842 length:1959 start_codon:yes stop_codon:yes gene_type:complete